MDYDDCFKPYNPKIRGELEEYLVSQWRGNASNLFFGSKYFFILKGKNLFLPLMSVIRIDRNPSPDICYFVNKDFLLESGGTGHINMSAIGAKKGIYNPKEILDNKMWSASGLNLEILLKQKMSKTPLH